MAKFQKYILLFQFLAMASATTNLVWFNSSTSWENYLLNTGEICRGDTVSLASNTNVSIAGRARAESITFEPGSTIFFESGSTLELLPNNMSASEFINCSVPTPYPASLPSVAFSTLSNRVVQTGVEFNFTYPVASIFSDSNGEVLKYQANYSWDGVTFTAIPRSGSWIQFNASNVFSGKVTDLSFANKTVSVRLYAINSAGSAYSSFSLSIHKRPPVLKSKVPTLVADINRFYTSYNPSTGDILGATFVDPDGDNLTYSFNNLPDWLVAKESFLSYPIVLQGTPTAAHIGNTTFQFIATNSNGTWLSTNINILVQPVDSAGGTGGTSNSNLPSAKPIPPAVGVVNSTRVVKVDPSTFYYPNGDSLIYVATLQNDSALPPWIKFNATTVSFTVTNPSEQHIGEYQVKIIAYSAVNGQAVSSSMKLTVDRSTAPVNKKVIVNQRVSIGSPFQMSIDPDVFVTQTGEGVNFTVTMKDAKLDSWAPYAGKADWLKFTPAKQTFSGSPGMMDTGGLVVNITATDAINGLSSSTSFVVIVDGFGPIKIGVSALGSIAGILTFIFFFFFDKFLFTHPHSVLTKLGYCQRRMIDYRNKMEDMIKGMAPKDARATERTLKSFDDRWQKVLKARGKWDSVDALEAKGQKVSKSKDVGNSVDEVNAKKEKDVKAGDKVGPANGVEGKGPKKAAKLRKASMN